MECIRKCNKRKYRNIQCVLEALATGLVIWPAQFITPCKRDRMDQYIDLSKMVCGFLGYGCDLIILGHITLFDPLTPHFFCKRFDASFEHFARVANSDVCTFTVKRLCNSPGDRPVICQTKNQCVLAFK